MRVALIPHPHSPAGPIRAVAVAVGRPGPGRLALSYTLTGEVARVRLPAPAAPERTDGLWQTTCCEAFVRTPGAEGYTELNFSPAGPWAAYRFTAYRTPAGDVAMPAPAITTREDGDQLLVAVEVDWTPPEGALLAVTVVLEDLDGAKSYWALAHPPGAPDFHHEAGFRLSLPPLESA